MNLKPFRQGIGHLRAKLFKLAPAEQTYDQQEMEQLAAEIIEYGRMKQKHYGSQSVVLAGRHAWRRFAAAHAQQPDHPLGSLAAGSAPRSSRAFRP